MVAPLRTASITAPAFFGLNTMDSEVTLDPKFARSAENCIIDEGGRIGSRKGWQYISEYFDDVSITSSGTTATVTHTAHSLETGEYVTIRNCNETEYNGEYEITVVDADTYTYTFAGSATSPATAVTDTDIESVYKVDLQGMHRFIDINGDEYFGAWNNSEFFIKNAGLITPVTYSGSNSITTGNWQAATLNDAAYLFQRGYKPIYFNPTTGVLDDVISATNSATVTIANTSTVTIANTTSVTLTHSGTVATADHPNHRLSTGDSVIISGATETQYNGTFTITVLDDNTYEYTMGSSPSQDATGSPVANTDIAIVTSSNHGFSTGQEVLISNANEAGYNGTFNITFIDADTYYYTMSSIPTTDATGTISASIKQAVVTHADHPFITGDEVTISGATPSDFNGTFEITVLSDNVYYYTMLTTPTSNPTGTLTSAWDKGTPPEANTVLSAYGRIWAADTILNKTTVYWSDLLDGTDWKSGTAGSLDISGILVKGNDEIVGLGAHNGRLIIFCKNNIIIMSDTDNNNQYLTPSQMQLVEVINGVGCVARDSIANTGTDIMFLSESGVRSLGRTIQEKSQPVNDISRNVRDTLVAEVARADATKIRGVYSDHFAFYLLTIPDDQTVYCFDMRAPLQNGAHRVTRWNGLDHTDWLSFDGQMYMTNDYGIAEYRGYQDNGESYQMQYYTNYFDFGMSNMIKIVKNIAATVIGSTGQKFVSKIGTDYEDLYTSYNLTVKEGTVSEYNIAEYNTDAEYSGGVNIDNVRIPAGGSGFVIQLGFESTINGGFLNIQQIDLYVKQGRLH